MLQVEVGTLSWEHAREAPSSPRSEVPPVSPFLRCVLSSLVPWSDGSVWCPFEASEGGSWVFSTLGLAWSAFSFSFLYPLVTLTTHDSLNALGQMPFQDGKQSGGGLREGREDRHRYILF